MAEGVHHLTKLPTCLDLSSLACIFCPICGSVCISDLGTNKTQMKRIISDPGCSEILHRLIAYKELLLYFTGFFRCWEAYQEEYPAPYVVHGDVLFLLYKTRINGHIQTHPHWNSNEHLNISRMIISTLRHFTASWTATAAAYLFLWRYVLHLHK